MKTHFHFEITTLMAMRDRKLAQIISAPADIRQARSELHELQAQGHKYLVVGDCDNKNPDGSCAGHQSNAEEA